MYHSSTVDNSSTGWEWII